MIVGVTGLLGAGKSAFATQLAIGAARSTGAVVASNIRVVPPAGVEAVQLATGVDGLDLEDLERLRQRVKADGRGLVLLLDEVGLTLPARFWASFPVPLMWFFTNSRHLGVDIIWVSQDEADVESSLRRRTQYVYKVRRLPAPKVKLGKSMGRPWLLHVSRWSAGQVGKESKRLGWELMRWRREWESWFDTEELVAPAERVVRAGRGRSRAPRAAGSLPLGSDAAEGSPVGLV